jgi:hypothetical protein
MDAPQFSAGDSEKLSPAVVASIAVLAILAAIYFIWPACRACLPMEIDSNEAWHAYHADAVRNAETLYPEPDSLATNNYPPLSYYLVGGIAAVTFDATYVGRLLSILAVAAIMRAMAFCLRQFGASRVAALVAGLWFLATASRFFDSYVGMNDPHMFALAIMIWALVWFLRRMRDGRSVEPAILLMVIAGFFKHTLFAIPATAMCWLAMHDRRLAVRAAIVGAGAAALGLALCTIIYGDVFFRQLFMPREYKLIWAFEGLGRLQWIAPGLAIFGICTWRRRRDEAVRFVWLFVLIAFFIYFVQKIGAGVYDNAQFELAIAASIGLGLAFDCIGADTLVPRREIDLGRVTIVLILLARLLASSHTEPYLLLFSPDFRAMLHQKCTIMEDETRRTAAIPGPVVCMVKKDPVLTVSRRAGKPFVYDGFGLDQRIKLGKMTEVELKERLRAQGIRLEQVDPGTTLWMH